MAPAGSAWTDRERIAYLFCLLENTGGKLDYNSTPLPNGRSLIACQRMMDRLKDQYKGEIAAIKNGDPMPGAAPAVEGKGTPVKTTPKRGRKAAAVDGGEQEGTPTKRPRGRPSKKKADEAPEDDQENIAKEDVTKAEDFKEEIVKEEPDFV